MIDEERFELMTIDMLRDDLNYNYISGKSIDRFYDQILLKETLISSLIKINPNLDDKVIIETINHIKYLNENNLILNNKTFSKYLLNGISIPKMTPEGEVYEVVKLIDFENINNNNFLVTNQFTIEEHSIKRPDIIIFINGIPLVVMELKSPFREEATLEDAYKQLKGYINVHIPSLFNYNQILIISDGVIAKAGTITSSYTRFTEWKKTSIDDKVSRLNSHESLIYGMLNKKTLLDLIRNYILYTDDNKILPAYHQYYGVEKAIAKTLTTKDGKAGIIWHTQGSGKSFSMVFYAGNMIEKLNNPTIVVVTDRNDLDNQLFETFLKCEDYLKQKAVQTNSRQDLIDKIKDIKAGGIFFTTLQKFNEDTGLLSKRNNILVIVDEAHRSHYGHEAIVKFDKESQRAYKKFGTAKHLRDGLPNAIYIGFTGTPIENKDRSTSNIFGKVIDIYDMTQSIEDGSTVPIHYESRMSKIKLNETLLEKIDDYYQSLEDENIEQRKIIESQNSMATVKQIIEDPDRLRLIVEDIINHYEERKNIIANKVMVVAYSRRSAYLMYKLFLKLKPEYEKNINMIITPSNSDPEEMQKAIGSKKSKQELETQFKDPDSNFKIAIVVDMWLTGFDVPSLGTMYVDKPMKAHNLMQAIARVNRVYKDKTGGLIIDYIGLKKWLLEALKTYTKRDQSKVIDSSELLKTLNDKVELIRNLLHGFNYNHFMNLDNKEKYRLINEGADYILKTEDSKKRFMKYSQDIKGLYSIISGLLTNELKDEILYFISIRSFLSKINNGQIDVKEINEKVAKILEEAIQDDELILIGEVSKSNTLNLLNDDMLDKLSKMKTRNIVADILSRSIKSTIASIGATNIVLMQKFSEKFKKIVNSYNERTSNTDVEQMIEAMINLKKEIFAEMKAGNKFNLSTEEKAFFDALGNDPEVKELMKDETLVKIAKELVDTVNKNMSIDWDIRENARAKMRYEIKLLLIKYNYPPIKRESAVETVIKQTELKCSSMFN